jgi:hypothetical protein
MSQRLESSRSPSIQRHLGFTDALQDERTRTVGTALRLRSGSPERRLSREGG